MSGDILVVHDYTIANASRDTMVSDIIISYIYTTYVVRCILRIYTPHSSHMPDLLYNTQYTNDNQALPLHGCVQRTRRALHIPNYGACITALPLTGDYHHRQLYSPCAVADGSD